MSADDHSVCPKCHPEGLNKVGVWQASTNADGPSDVRENYQTYWQVKQVDPANDLDKLGLFLVYSYRATCWTCDFTFTHEFETPITGLS